MREVDIPGTELLLRALESDGHVTAQAGRRALIAALDAAATRTGGEQVPMVEQAISQIGNKLDMCWAVSAAYWLLARREGKLQEGVVFTPPTLAEEVARRLRPRTPVVDLGAGTGMLTLAAAFRGFEVTAVEKDRRQSAVLEKLAKLTGVWERVRVVNADALHFVGVRGSQIVSNPPYTRHQRLPATRKRTLQALARRISMPLHSTAGYYAYFMIYAWQARWSVREVLLVPSNWLQTAYGDPLRRQLATVPSAEIAVADHRTQSSMFDHSLATACIVTTDGVVNSVGRQARLKQGQVVALRTGPRKQGAKAPTELVQRWESQIRAVGNSTNSRRSTRLGDILAVHRGIATGANGFFVLSESEAREAGIPRRELVPVVRTLVFRRWRDCVALLWVPGRDPSPKSMAMIQRGRRLGVHKRYLCSQRELWWRVDIQEKPNYFLGYMGRGAAKLRRNPNGFVSLNNIHGLYPVKGVHQAVVEHVVNWLRTESGQKALLRVARHYQGGLWKLEPRDVQRVIIPKRVWNDAILASK